MKKVWTRVRSSITGRFVKKGTEQTAPETTQTETVTRDSTVIHINTYGPR